jgi:hypothetical protein
MPLSPAAKVFNPRESRGLLLTAPRSARTYGLMTRACCPRSSGWWAIVGLLALGVPARASPAPPLQAGVARLDLTPPPELKAALGGYGARMSKPARGVHDAVWTKALVLVQGDRRFALVTADVLAFPPSFKTAVVERLGAAGWQAAQVMLLPSHTHTSIDMMALHPGNTFGIPQVGLFHKALFEHTADRLARVVREAQRDPLPIRAGSAAAAVAGKVRNRRAANAAQDPAMTVTRIDALGGRPLAVLVNWSAHPTFMNEEDMLFSGDWPGHLQRGLEALIGPGVTALFYNGAEGDQAPVPPTGSASNWERAERYGREMSLLAWRLWEGIPPREVALFDHATERIDLPPRQWHPDFMKTGGAEYGLSEAMMQSFVEHLVPPQTQSTSLRLGDLVIVGVPGELAAELGLEIKSRVRRATGAGCVTIGGLADEWISYILPSAEYRAGGYEASMSFYGETLGPTLVEAVARSAPARHNPPP